MANKRITNVATYVMLLEKEMNMKCSYLRGPVKSGPNAGWYYCNNPNIFLVDVLPPGLKPGLYSDTVEKCLEGECERPNDHHERIVVPPGEPE